jgi:hypothetical protein
MRKPVLKQQLTKMHRNQNVLREREAKNGGSD